MSKKRISANLILRKLYDFAYKFIDIPFFDFQKFKYILLGSLNIGLSWILYFILYNFIVLKENVDVLGLLTISPHIFSFLASFAITFFTGFFLNYYLVFNRNTDDGRLIRKLCKYLISTIGSVLINYLLLKLFVEKFEWYPTPSQMLCTCIVTIYSYVAQQKFTFALRRDS